MNVILSLLWLLCCFVFIVFQHLSVYNHTIERPFPQVDLWVSYVPFKVSPADQWAVKHTTHESIELFSKYCHTEWILCTTMPFTQLQSVLSRVWSIQYIGKYLSWVNPSYIATLLENTTAKSPYRAEPYTFWSIVLPAQTKRNDKDDNAVNHALEIGEKWVYYLCSSDKTDSILSLDEQEYTQLIHNNSGEYNPCSSYKIPYFLWFNYFLYKQDYAKATDYYKITAAHDATPPWIAWMIWIINQRTGDRETTLAIWKSQIEIVRASFNETSDEEKKAILAQEELRSYKKWVLAVQLDLITRSIDSSLFTGEQLFDNIVTEYSQDIEQTLQKDLRECQNTQTNFCWFLTNWMNDAYITNSLPYFLHPQDSEQKIYKYYWNNEINKRATFDRDRESS